MSNYIGTFQGRLRKAIVLYDKLKYRHLAAGRTKSARDLSAIFHSHQNPSKLTGVIYQESSWKDSNRLEKHERPPSAHNCMSLDELKQGSWRYICSTLDLTELRSAVLKGMAYSNRSVALGSSGFFAYPSKSTTPRNPLGLPQKVYFYSTKSKRSPLPLPPGPKKLPLLGNLLDFPKRSEWLKYAEWAEEFNSNIIHIYAFGKNLIILNSFEAALDLCDKRSSIYSSRPGSPMLNDLMGWRWAMSAMVYGEPWRERRRMFQKHFHPSNAQFYQPIQREFIRKMLPRLLDAPAEFLGISRHTIGGMALSMSYGIEIKQTNDSFIDLAEAAMISVGLAARVGAFLVDVIPILKYVPEFMPGAGFQKQARIWRKLQEDFRERPFSASIEAMASGRARPSFTSVALGDVDESLDIDHQREVIKDTAGLVFAGGSDTTVSATHTFFLAMVCFPEIQMKAQAELDRVVSGRLPDFDDMEDLPYISALVKEVLRWQPVTPRGIPHRTTEDDVYEGYHIPNGSIVIFNSWAMLHNEAEYPDPFAFKPERFLKDGRLDSRVRDPATIAFGFGRRICPGNHIAFSTLWLTAASVLATFQLSKPVDKDGRVIEPSRQYTDTGVFRHPLPFECIIKPRSNTAEGLIRSAADAY
ncbi:cytochrome P450 [Phlegmacium glaucopus]|nr:cytochrome P450 [Phlegmacium glaucopus]